MSSPGRSGCRPIRRRPVGRIKDIIQTGRYRTVGLGLADDRYFTFQRRTGHGRRVIQEVERLRAAGRKESPGLFARTIVRHWATGTDRHRPALTLERDGQPAAADLFWLAVTNRSP